MTEQDLNSVHGIERKSFRNPWSRQSIAREIRNPDSLTLVVEKDHFVVGYVICWCVCDEAHVGTLAVDSRFRRTKIGEKLLRQLTKDLTRKNINHVYLEVRHSNLAAQKLYKKFGFKVSGVRKNYYSKENEDALLMSLSLKEGLQYGLV
ncbi:ribosomal protein S18-alanine N-acetyltransferase [candidate division KSB1 bacterium]|nr:ribosomal protein S18-alanine N-acetyltransferase [candidate division KSB1 bacterium]NIR70684.1 ribosomal protein S18-alanine N-acetyltransferase [candidate division KSB1 bacterium]NIS26036.1 ribosomal protein S18-alanine N-acetyltransferase [candidate division KSB1 bacterium]NIT72860.1 ribosomal protein S18-alanine N-acetyltransferase [candidate division KSB1 bacterium]NIU26701.1 ribosomal protein S18-alanine N-acetyltransferase [candidate division KSB1 bacterium]